MDKALLALKGLLVMIEGDGDDDDHSVHCESYGIFSLSRFYVVYVHRNHQAY